MESKVITSNSTSRSLCKMLCVDGDYFLQVCLSRVMTCPPTGPSVLCKLSTAFGRSEVRSHLQERLPGSVVPVRDLSGQSNDMCEDSASRRSRLDLIDAHRAIAAAAS